MSGNLVSSDYQTILMGSRPLLDVRAPVEFAKGAFPHSSNIPLLSDEARHRVGIEYKEAGQESAIELGAKLLPEPARELLIKAWADFLNKNPDSYLYCFRGGLRSRISQQWLQEAGYDVPVVAGGYKALRQYLVESLRSLCESRSYCLIGGRTGSGKTRVLNQLPNSVDLEARAMHRGSSFGRLVVPQPSNIDFENVVTIDLIKLDKQADDVIFLEDEARMIGSACIPYPLRQQMQQAPVVVLETSLDERVSIAIEDYVVDLLERYQLAYGAVDGFNRYANYHRDSLKRVQKRFGGERYNQALLLLNKALSTHELNGETHDYYDFIKTILTEYYDPMYDYQTAKKQQRIVFRGNAEAILDWSQQVELSVG